jgi:DNA-binding transcriptional ArsR family regulator
MPDESSASSVPDYELDSSVAADTAAAIRAVTEPTRARILDLVLERAASVTELSVALGRAKGTVAHHVDVLLDVGLLKVVRTRKVRAMEERFYGRTGRTIVIGVDPGPSGVRPSGFLAQAMNEAPEDPSTLATLRHARIPADRAAEFFEEVVALAEKFTRLRREGDVVHGFVAGVYPTDHPTLPPPAETPRRLS